VATTQVEFFCEISDYTLILKCPECCHERITQPHTLGLLVRLNAKLEDVEKRMRCSICGKKNCTARAVPPRKPRGYSSLPR
jgi:hypothetical protein